MKEKKYPKGALILAEGSTGEEIFLIISWKVRVFKTINEEKVELGILGRNDFFGEMSMFLDRKRTASVEALENSKIKVGNKAVFVNSIKKNPNSAIRIISTLIKRLYAAHKIISEKEGQIKGYEILLTPFD